MRARQRGMTLLGLIAGSFVLVILALLVMRLAPSYIEYFTIKKDILGIAHETRGHETNPNEIRRLFENRMAIDNIYTIGPKDLVINKAGSDYVISASYRREVPLFANIGVYIDFEVSSQ